MLHSAERLLHGGTPFSASLPPSNLYKYHPVLESCTCVVLLANKGSVPNLLVERIPCLLEHVENHVCQCHLLWTTPTLTHLVGVH